eukprot:TRINITY_DN1616_c1_g1_i1.p1 TRINITY_DN1616_c1_g1~~TRINITY_DN1616_c1_g1_i1.p1  ORF type:complete len:107 (+),score=16.86 TRINITY_DN1616_c1_g1_i1:170-490(+)
MDSHQVIEEHDPMIDIFEPPELPNETFNLLKEYCESLWENGVESILSEQLKQKRKFDNKVSDKSDVINKDDRILFTNMPKINIYQKPNYKANILDLTKFCESPRAM